MEPGIVILTLTINVVVRSNGEKTSMLQSLAEDFVEDSIHDLLPATTAAEIVMYDVHVSSLDKQQIDDATEEPT